MQFIGTHTEETAQRIVRSFGHTEQLISAITAMFIRREDPLPCRQWPWHNQLLLEISDIKDARGVKEWQSIGREVRSGANALWLLTPCTMPILVQNCFGEEVECHTVFAYRSEPVYPVEDTVGMPSRTMPALCGNRIKHLPIWDIAQTIHSHESFFCEQSSFVELIRSEDQRLYKPRKDVRLGEIVAAIGAAVLFECIEEPREVCLNKASNCLARHARMANTSLFPVCLEVLDRVCESVATVLNTAESLQSLVIPA